MNLLILMCPTQGTSRTEAKLEGSQKGGMLPAQPWPAPT
jgi:hypothetical protein